MKTDEFDPERAPTSNNRLENRGRARGMLRLWRGLAHSECIFTCFRTKWSKIKGFTHMLGAKNGFYYALVHLGGVFTHI